MAAEIHSRPQSSRPVLLSKIEGHQDAVTAALLIPKEDGVITASEDRTIRVWLKRDSGQYWPSIYHTMASPCSAMAYHHDSRRIFVGQDNGAVMEFHVSEDFNKMNFIKTYPAHQNRVTAIIFSLATEWVISTGHDKCVSWMCTRSGNMLGRHFSTSWTSCLQYDFDTQYAFVGDCSGQISLLKLEQSSCSVITTLKGHEGSVACLWWDPIQRLLFSGASDNSIIMWDIGGRKGRTLLLQGHHDRVQSLCYLQLTRQLVSCSSDGGIAVWNMDVSREEAPQWLESDSCQKCEQPFFWNIKQMWDTKTLGLRQIHFILLFSRQGKLRLQKWYTTLPDKERKKITREIVQIILSRGQRTSSFVDWKELKLVYKRYASLYFCCAVENQDNELLTLETVHRYVELLDKYFGNVCELDIIFNFEKAYFILDEFIIGGEIQETSKKSAVKAIEDSDMLQETMEEYMNKPTF
ncbi:WD repeat and FYVE domain-containing protein 1 isoform X2 [Tursiops truncatus]|uniref:WD repeat and FYVE domain-containing protein 1 n=1 Tax=Tursiops truncatus TaxID=9739 RepID=A0A6J3RMG8_TURTR|nr:WD repeat and FYVE domain-containing protein 1 isoform X1 [Tursiops truncatus]